MGLFIFCQLFAVNRDEIEYSTLLLPPYVKDVPINCSVCLLTLRTHPTINTDFFQDPRAIW